MNTEGDFARPIVKFARKEDTNRYSRKKSGKKERKKITTTTRKPSTLLAASELIGNAEREKRNPHKRPPTKI